MFARNSLAPRRRLKQLIRRVVGNPITAEDRVQRAFAKLLAKAARENIANPPDTATNRGAGADGVSKQIEAGAKADVGGMLLAAAAFDIEKAYEYTTADNVYTRDGRQKHRGIEFTATGKVTDRFTVLGGLTVLDARIVGGTSQISSPRFMRNTNCRRWTAFSSPEASTIPDGSGRTASTRIGCRPYTRLDLGLRYQTRWLGTDTASQRCERDRGEILGQCLLSRYAADGGILRAAEILIDGVRWFRSGARPSAPPRRSMAAPWQFCHMMRK